MEKSTAWYDQGMEVCMILENNDLENKYMVRAP